MSKVYGFTNEYLTSYPDIYNFENADVLSVIGSGDQYFTAVLAGAKNVTLFDINKAAWFYFVLKYISISHLTYEEFYEFFLKDNLNNIRLYKKIRDYLPNNVKRFFDILRVTKKQFSSILTEDTLTKDLSYQEFSKIVPYLNEDSYYILQDLLRKNTLPECIIDNFINIALNYNLKEYNIALLSNIFDWMNISVETYKTLLDKFDNCTIQALYLWGLCGKADKFMKLGFELNEIPAVNPNLKIDHHNYLLSYKRVR